MEDNAQKGQDSVGILDLYVSFLALYSIVLLLVATFMELSAEMTKILAWADLAICAIFLVELFMRWRRETYSLRFWRWAWIDLLSSIPLMPWLRWGRSLRLLRLLQILRAVQGIRVARRHLNMRRKVGAPALAFFILYTIMMICAPAILLAEGGSPEANIRSAGDAVWWVFETVSTVGYGDYYPVTTVGRFIGVVTMIFGVGMFGAITATVLSIFGAGQDTPSATPEVDKPSGNGCNLP
jgi:voltage-gated potassium channel